MAKDLKFVMLLDCYGELLTSHQLNVMALDYCEDLSRSEIGNPMGITRQAVRALIKRNEQRLLNYEESLGFAERLSKMKECFSRIGKLADTLEDSETRNAIKAEINSALTLL